MTTRRWRQEDEGAALVEFTFVMVLFFLLLFGIITFGYMLAFKNSMTQAVNDGVRAAAVIPPGDTLPANGIDDRIDAARQGLEEEVGAFDKTCGDGGLTCEATIVSCVGDPLRECIKVELAYDNTGDNVLVPRLPLMTAIIPDEVRAEAQVQSQGGMP